MLTWAYAWFAKNMGEYMPLLFIVAMGCDASILYYIVCAVTGHKP